MRFWLSCLFHNSEILRKASLNLYIINYIRFSEMKINVLKGLFFLLSKSRYATWNDLGNDRTEDKVRFIVPLRL